MNHDRLEQLGFTLGERATSGESQGAWFATAPDGAPVVVKWFADSAAAQRHTILASALRALRDRDVPVPAFSHVIGTDDGVVAAQERLPGQSQDNPSPAIVEAIVACISPKVGLGRGLTAPGNRSWGNFVVDALTTGVAGWAMHEPFRVAGDRSAAVLARARAAGVGAESSWFPTDGLVHLDLHTDNVLIDDKRLTGIIDWDDACFGDHRFDLVAYAFDVDGHGQYIWEAVDALDIEPAVLRTYLAFLVLKSAGWALLHRPHDTTRQLDRAERVLSRFGL